MLIINIILSYILMGAAFRLIFSREIDLVTQYAVFHSIVSQLEIKPPMPEMIRQITKPITFKVFSILYFPFALFKTNKFYTHVVRDRVIRDWAEEFMNEIEETLPEDIERKLLISKIG